jgi:hypothetical protein
MPANAVGASFRALRANIIASIKMRKTSGGTPRRGDRGAGEIRSTWRDRAGDSRGVDVKQERNLKMKCSVLEGELSEEQYRAIAKCGCFSTAAGKVKDVVAIMASRSGLNRRDMFTIYQRSPCSDSGHSCT